MYDFIPPDQAREIIAETLLVFDVAMVCFIGSHLWREYRTLGFVRARSRLGNQAAVAFGVHIIGLAVIRWWSAIQYWLDRHGLSSRWLESHSQIALGGLVISVIGMACCIRIFSPARWGNWGWALTFLAALGFVGFMQAR